MNSNMEELITTLYDMIQDAKAVPLSSDKCIIERDKALDMLDELSAQMPGELKQARTIVQSRDELIAQARREAEVIIRNAQTQAEQLVTKETIYQQAYQRCQEMVAKTHDQMEQIKSASFGYVDNSLRQTEEAILKALNEVRGTRTKFQSIVDPAAAAAPAAGNSFVQDIED